MEGNEQCKSRRNSPINNIVRYNKTKSPEILPMKMQNVDFGSIYEFFDFLPENERVIVHFLRDIVYECIPDVLEKLSYNVPYYKRNSNICFIWPSSIVWGKNKTYEGVRFGFTKGYLLNDEDNYLEKGTRKQVYWKDFNDCNDVDIEIISKLLREALLVDSYRK